jgi:translation elongation factor EF-G
VSDKEWVKSRPYGPPLMMQRPAVIAIMGHKDHGKTTLLDKLRGCVERESDFQLGQRRSSSTLTEQ